ncbi:hypothetical protein [Paraburkholderia sp.]|uniref:hypothetical protein n=1 Tax=Paraburkholderia sp. TaxID=1926495 RepID=UPI002D7FA299|nr:hypothetical protein [Paraburkholderia sp.]
MKRVKSCPCKRDGKPQLSFRELSAIQARGTASILARQAKSKFSERGHDEERKVLMDLTKDL